MSVDILVLGIFVHNNEQQNAGQRPIVSKNYRILLSDPGFRDQYIGVQPAVIPVCGTAQIIEITVRVAVAREAWFAVIGALRRTGCPSAAKPWMAESGNNVLGEHRED